MPRSWTIALVASLIFVQSVGAAERWIHISTPHFEMYTTNGEKQAVAALQVFEQVRYFFLQASSSNSAPDAQVQIIAFKSEKEYKPYRLNEGAFAYYQRSRKIDYIVMQDISPEHHEAAVHEYTHLVTEHLNLKLPVWLNEGIADLYSSLTTRGSQALIGTPLAGREMVLAGQRWIDMNVLFSVDADSPYYNEKAKMSIFYAQSWALTHMLALGKTYRPNFAKFLAAAASGKPSAECFQTIYGKTLAQVTQDLHAYLNQASVQGELFNIQLNKAELEPEVTEASPLSVDLALADLLASQKRSTQEARTRLTKLAAEHLDSAEIQESLGYLALQEQDVPKAKQSFQIAYEKGSKDPQMLLYYSQILNSSNAPADQVLPVLKRAVEIKPDFQDAWFDMGETDTRSAHYGAALDDFSHLKAVKPDRAYALFIAQAYCYFSLKAPKPALLNAEKANQYAKTPNELRQASELLNAIHQASESASVPTGMTQTASSTHEAPDAATRRELPRDVPSVIRRGEIKHVEAFSKSFDCNSKRLHVLVDSKEMVFQFDDPDDVVVRNKKNGVVDFNCGSQKPVKLDIFYAPSPAKIDTDGFIRELVF